MTHTVASQPPPVSGVDPSSAWWASAVVYQIYPRSFADSNGDGIGDLRGILGKVGYLADLGVDVIWLSPVYPSPQDDNGYDISDYQNIDSVFGTLDDFDELLDALHGHGMKLIMDLVVNHTSDEHPWFIESRSSTTNPKRDWYWWRPARDSMKPGDPGAEPNNWGSFFSGPAWHLDPATNDYYLHLFSRKQPDLNWENPDVRAAIYSMMRWWLDRGVDGFRMDVINMISKDPALPDGPVIPPDSYGNGGQYFICGPRIHEYLAEMHREVFAGRTGQYLTVGEMPGVSVDDASLFTDPRRRELDMVFQFEHVTLDQGTHKWDRTSLNLADLKASLGKWQMGLAAAGWNSLYWNNHDQPRAVSRFGNDNTFRIQSATMLAIVLHLHRGTPYIYQGEELGMTNPPLKRPEDFQDIESVNYYNNALRAGEPEATVLHALQTGSRDNARSPVQWEATSHAGFTTGTPWFPVNPNAADINADAAIADTESIHHYYRRLIRLRHTEPVIVHGDFHMLLADHPTIYAYQRTYQRQILTVLGNFSDEPTPLPENMDWAASTLLIGNYPIPLPGDRATLRPWEARGYLHASASDDEV